MNRQAAYTYEYNLELWAEEPTDVASDSTDITLNDGVATSPSDEPCPADCPDDLCGL